MKKMDLFHFLKDRFNKKPNNPTKKVKETTAKINLNKIKADIEKP
jgi:hypothetical protein